MGIYHWSLVGQWEIWFTKHSFFVNQLQLLAGGKKYDYLLKKMQISGKTGGKTKKKGEFSLFLEKNIN